MTTLVKMAMLSNGIGLVQAFCERNGLSVPALQLYSRAEWRYPSTCAYYRPETIHIAVDRCSHIGTANRAWSYPGYITDRTPYGVMAHELGHHVDHTLSKTKGSYGGNFSEDMRAESGEPRLTSYCPNDWEWFAEMFRLFATNPTLLQAVRPKTFTLMITGGLRPVDPQPWREVLKDAPARTLAMAERKVAGL